MKKNTKNTKKVSKKQYRNASVGQYISSRKLTNSQKKKLDKAIDKVILDYGKTLKMLQDH